MATKKPKRVSDISAEAMKKRIEDMVNRREYWLEHLHDKECYVRLQAGNTKTGSLSKTVSLCPVIDCGNCNKCKHKCYDLRNDCCYKECRNDRARNSAIHKSDPERYFWEITKAVKEEFVIFLRLNVGGDFGKEDYDHIRKMGDECNRTTFQFFTKNTRPLIEWYDKGNELPQNVRKLVSKWEWMDIPNPYNWPEAHVLWADGSTTAPDFGAYYCKGYCSACYFYQEGCPYLKDGESVVMNAH